jgi:hypothetical protein
MMKHRILILAIVNLIILGSHAQYDKNWLMGGGGVVANVHFHENPVQVDSLFGDPNQPFASTSVSTITNIHADSIFFWSNGLFIGDRKGKLVMNSEYNVDDVLYNDYSFEGSQWWQSSIMLPRDDSSFYVINQSISDSLGNTPTYQPDRLYYTVVNMNGNGGKGIATQKRVPILKGIMGEGRLTACRHANGRDWWLIQTGCNNNEYHIILCTPDTIIHIKTQAIGLPTNQPDSQGQAVFSPDGSRYAHSTQGNQTMIFDFDRCTGTLSNEKAVKFPSRTVLNLTYPIPGAIGLAFSPDGQKLYGNTNFTIFQISNYSDTATAVLRVIGEKDVSYVEQYPFEQASLMPNGKICIGTYGGSTEAFHTIDSADNLANPKFVYRGFPVDYILSAGGVSNMPHYRLGRLIGSACDTLIKDTIPEGINAVNSLASVKVYPNPASSYVVVSLMEYGADAQLTITDITGKVVHEQSMYLDAQVDVSRWVSGMYLVRIDSRGRKPVVGKFVRE